MSTLNTTNDTDTSSADTSVYRPSRPEPFQDGKFNSTAALDADYAQETEYLLQQQVSFGAGGSGQSTSINHEQNIAQVLDLLTAG